MFDFIEEFIGSIKESFTNNIGTDFLGFGKKLILTVIILVIGFWLIRKIMKAVGKILDTKNVDETLKPFLITLAGFILKALLFLTAAGVVGIPVMAFGAVLGAMGLAIAMAMQGSLSNFASGVLLLIFRPYKSGDLIEAQGELGFVKELSVFVTIIETFQNKTVIIPNGPLLGGNIKNYSTLGNVRSDIPFAIRYGSDVDKAISIVNEILAKSDLVLSEPAPSVYVTELTNTNIQLTALPFSTVDNYWDVFWGLRKEIVTKLGEAGFEAPYEQRVIHMENK